MIFSRFFEFFIYIISISNRTRCRLCNSSADIFRSNMKTIIIMLNDYSSCSVIMDITSIIIPPGGTSLLILRPVITGQLRNRGVIASVSEAIYNYMRLAGGVRRSWRSNNEND